MPAYGPNHPGGGSAVGPQATPSFLQNAYHPTGVFLLNKPPDQARVKRVSRGSGTDPGGIPEAVPPEGGTGTVFHLGFKGNLQAAATLLRRQGR